MAPSWLLGGRYRLESRIAAGGMGEVWRATDLVLERPVALKLLRPELAQHEEDLARFRAEARHAGSVSHPGIAQIYDYCEGDTPGRPYLVMELVNGRSLAQLLDECPLDAAFTMGIIAQAARGLQAAHEAGLVHRDIKPGNLLVSQSGHVKITDFGIAHTAGMAPVTQTGMMICTPAYLAPERAVGAPATPAADLYALGIVAFRCLTGRVPYTGDPLAVALAHQLQSLPPLPPSVPPGVAALVADLTAKDPRARPASAGHAARRAEQLHAALTGAAGRSLTAASLTSPGARIPPPHDSPGNWLDGNRHHQPQGRRPPASILWPARAVLAATVVAAIGVAGWKVANTPSPAAAPRQPPTPASVARPSSGHRDPAAAPAPSRVVAISTATNTKAGHQRPPQHRPSTSAPPTPSPSAASPTPTASFTSPAPSATPTPSASSPSPTPTPTPPASISSASPSPALNSATGRR